jgi:glycine hydroxymethyltransferase
MNYIFELTKKEADKQANTLNLIASENYPSPKVLELLGAKWSNKYGEGYPGKRYYAGNQFTDKLETFAQEKALEVYSRSGFNAGDEYGVNVQVLSGSPANAMVFLAMLEAGDTVLSLNLSNGGHLSHLHKTSNWLKFFKLENYDVVENGTNNYEIDLKDFEAKLIESKPRLTIIGASSYPKSIDFKPMIELAHKHGSLVLADIAHINGLVAAGLHPSPFNIGESGADFVTMTTHKTFRGPRAAMLFYKNDFAKDINKTVFPGTSGGPHFNKIAAITQACLEILGEDQHPDGISFKDYSQKVLDNCKAMENSLLESGLEIVSPSDNHMCLVKLPDDSDSLEIQVRLEEIGVICNRNVIPFDKKSAWRPSGLRLGSPALTSRGLDESGAKEIGAIIADCVFARQSQEELAKRVQGVVQGLKRF